MKKSNIRLSALSREEFAEAIEQFYKSASDTDLADFHDLYCNDHLYPISEIPQNAMEMANVKNDSIPEGARFLALLYDDEHDRYQATFVSDPYSELWQKMGRGDTIVGKHADIESLRHSIQLGIDTMVKGPSEDTWHLEAPKALVDVLSDAIHEAEKRNPPFLSYTVVHSNFEDSYQTQEKFFEELGRLYESLRLSTKICNVRLNGKEVEASTIEDAFRVACDSYRDTFETQAIPGMREISLSGESDVILRFPGGTSMAFSEWRKKGTQSSSLFVSEPSREGEHHWETVIVTTDDFFCGDVNGAVVLCDGKPVHAFLLGIEEVQSSEDATLLSTMAEDYIVKQVIDETPLQINLNMYSLMSDFHADDEKRFFTLPVFMIINAQNGEPERERGSNVYIAYVDAPDEGRIRPVPCATREEAVRSIRDILESLDIPADEMIKNMLSNRVRSSAEYYSDDYNVFVQISKHQFSFEKSKERNFVPKEPTVKNLVESLHDVVNAYREAGLSVHPNQLKNILFSSDNRQPSSR